MVPQPLPVSRLHRDHAAQRTAFTRRSAAPCDAIMRRHALRSCGAPPVGVWQAQEMTVRCNAALREMCFDVTRNRQHCQSLSSRFLLSISLSCIISLSFFRLLCSSMMTISTAVFRVLNSTLPEENIAHNLVHDSSRFLLSSRFLFVGLLCSSMMTCCLLPCLPSSRVVIPSKCDMCHSTSLILFVCRRLRFLSPTFKPACLSIVQSPLLSSVC